MLALANSLAGKNFSEMTYFVGIYGVGRKTLMNTLECGPVPNMMVALLNIGGALCSTPQSLADAHY